MPKLFPGLAVLVFATAQTTSAFADILQASGRITFLRVHEMGSRFGPPGDEIDVEVVIRLDTREGMAFGFQLRAGPALAAHQGMLDVLRDAFNHGWTVTIDYDIQPGRKNGLLIRAAATKPGGPLARVVDVPNIVIARKDPAAHGVLDPATLAHAPPPGKEPSGGHALFEETQWEPVEEIQLAAGASRDFQVPVEAPALLLVHASWTGTGVPPTVRVARGGNVLATGSPTPVPPNQGSVLARARIDASGHVTVTFANPGPDPASLRVAVGVLRLPS
jgi:hypothetical protein